MRKQIFGLAAFMLMLLLTQTAFAASSTYGDKQFSLTVNDERGFYISTSVGQVTDSVQAFIYTAGTKTLATIYADRKRTTKANPITTTQFAIDKQVLFYGPNASYDIFIAHNDGSTQSVLAVTPLQHRISLNRNSGERHMVIPWTAPGTTETSTLNLPYDSIVHMVSIEVVTAESGKTLSVGLLSSQSNGSATGFVNAVSTTTAGYPALSVFTVGGSETYFASTVLGSFFQVSDAGANTALHYGSFWPSSKIITGANANTVSYTGSSGSSTGTGYIHLFFRLLR